MEVGYCVDDSDHVAEDSGESQGLAEIVKIVEVGLEGERGEGAAEDGVRDEVCEWVVQDGLWGEEDEGEAW